tara:strand:- start:954 stop:1808 length:855 start_codon:yes stop_codon:yes gene_type:complete
MGDLRDLFFEELVQKMKDNKNTILLSIDMGSQIVNQNMDFIKNQYFNVGVSEANAISMAVGLSSRGYEVFVYGISTFIFNRPRAQIRHDSIIGNNPINIIGSGDGLTYPQDGPSHHSVDDFVSLSSLPKSSLIIPFDKESVKKTFEICNEKNLTTFIKLDKGQVLDEQLNYNNGFYFKIKNKKQWVFTTGKESMNYIEEKYKDHSIACLLATSPKNELFFKKYIDHNTKIIVDDETFTYGGLFSYLATIHAITLNNNIVNKTFNNEFIQEKYNRETLRNKYGIK